MKRTFALLALILVVLVGISAAQSPSGPFGLSRGMTKTQVITLVGKGEVAENKKDWLELKSVPKPHQAFESYLLYFSPTEGLLKIIAVGKTIQTNDAGTEIQNEFEHIAAALGEKYGTPREIDNCNGGVGCSGPSVWMLGLLEKNRRLSAFWEVDDPRTMLHGVVFDAVALDLNHGYFRLIYEFDGWGAYLRGKQAVQNDAF